MVYLHSCTFIYQELLENSVRMPSRKASRNGFDYATPATNYPHNAVPYYPYGVGGATTYPTHAYPTGYTGYMNGWVRGQQMWQ